MPEAFHPCTVTADRLRLERGGRAVLDGLSFSASAGEAVELVGPNGSGKTTLLRALAGLAAPDAGAITHPEPEQIAFSGHADPLKPSETVETALRFWARLHGRDEAEVVTALAAMRARHLKRRECGRLSAGQRRRVALARVILLNRPVWLLDEPAAPLDAAGRTSLAEAVTAQRARGGLVIAATHQGLDWPDAQRLDLALLEGEAVR
ncbi:MAG: heme ABC exporter ATP-binding protein CcmA [Pseudomonadota bacterium]